MSRNVPSPRVARIDDALRVAWHIARNGYIDTSKMTFADVDAIIEKFARECNVSKAALKDAYWRVTE